MDRLLEEYTDAEVAEQLNQQGYRTFVGLPFQSIHVSQLRRHHGIPSRYARLQAQGMLSEEEPLAAVEGETLAVGMQHADLPDPLAATGVAAGAPDPFATFLSVQAIRKMQEEKEPESKLGRP